MNVTRTLLATTVLIAASGATHAALYDRGRGMIYDSTQNITWLQDANFAKTSNFYSGIGWGGAMDWEEAYYWAYQLTYAGYSDWRLPSANQREPLDQFAYDGSRDIGYNVANSELGHLMLELGNKPYHDTTGAMNPDWGLVNATFIDAATGNSVSFLNLLEAKKGYTEFWEDEITGYSHYYGVWRFNPDSGYQYPFYSTGRLYAWAVRDGDVAAVPIAPSAWLLGSALLTLFGVGRKRRG